MPIWDKSDYILRFFYFIFEESRNFINFKYFNWMYTSLGKSYRINPEINILINKFKSVFKSLIELLSLWFYKILVHFGSNGYV